MRFVSGGVSKVKAFDPGNPNNGYKLHNEFFNDDIQVAKNGYIYVYACPPKRSEGGSVMKARWRCISITSKSITNTAPSWKPPNTIPSASRWPIFPQLPWCRAKTTNLNTTVRKNRTRNSATEQDWIGMIMARECMMRRSGGGMWWMLNRKK